MNQVFGIAGPLTRLIELGPTLLPLLLGAAGVYLLLPRPRGRAAFLGAALGLTALAICAFVLVHVVGRVRPEAVLFFAFSGLAIGAGAMLVTQKNPARAALSFAVVILSVCGLFLLQAAPFLMAATVIIYAGAIIVTFLFVLMLAHQGGPSDADDRSRNPLLATVAGFALLGCLVLSIGRAYDTRTLDELVARADLASRQTSDYDIRAVLRGPGPGTADEFGAALLREVDRLKGTDGRDTLGEAALNLLKELDQAQPDPERERAALGRVVAAGTIVRTEFGALHAGSLLFSGYAGAPANVEGASRALPAENVAGLGRTLYSDHLLAVELGGTLLLVATIGAIAITGRREVRA